MYKKILYITILAFFVTSCGDTMHSVKRGLTGAKADSSDEFLIQKKDPLILPPDFENLPQPDQTSTVTEEEEFLVFEKALENVTEDNAPPSSSIEDSILKKIQSK
tara:strand:- start:453 stop:767 length:315 start_codon:yes stop_codon:yes gene_type:complete